MREIRHQKTEAMKNSCCCLREKGVNGFGSAEIEIRNIAVRPSTFPSFLLLLPGDAASHGTTVCVVRIRSIQRGSENTESRRWEKDFNQPAIDQAQSLRKELCFPGRHSFDVLNQQCGILLVKAFVKKLDLYIHDRFVAKSLSKDTTNRETSLDTHFAANVVNSSCAMFEVVSLDWMSLSALFSRFPIPSF